MVPCQAVTIDDRLPCTILSRMCQPVATDLHGPLIVNLQGGGCFGDNFMSGTLGCHLYFCSAFRGGLVGFLTYTNYTVHHPTPTDPLFSTEVPINSAGQMGVAWPSAARSLVQTVSHEALQPCRSEDAKVAWAAWAQDEKDVKRHMDDTSYM